LYDDLIESHATAVFIVARVVPMAPKEAPKTPDGVPIIGAKAAPHPVGLPDILKMPHVIIRHPPSRQNPLALDDEEEAALLRMIPERALRGAAGPDVAYVRFIGLVPRRRKPKNPAFPTVTLSLGAD
jgi:hypothetical protein